MITGDEKWIIYDNPTRKRSWIKKGEKAQTIAKPGLTRKKVMLRVWWDWKGIVHYELLSFNQTINSELYCEQLQKLQQAIERKRPELIKERCHLPSRQRSTTHIFDDSAKIARAWLGSFNASTV